MVIVVATVVQNLVATTTTSITNVDFLPFNFEVGRLGFVNLVDVTVDLQNRVAAASAATSLAPNGSG